jgi:hypothetical protein
MCRITHFDCRDAFIVHAAQAQPALQRHGDFSLHVRQFFLDQLIGCERTAKLLRSIVYWRAVSQQNSAAPHAPHSRQAQAPYHFRIFRCEPVCKNRQSGCKGKSSDGNIILDRNPRPLQRRGADEGGIRADRDEGTEAVGFENPRGFPLQFFVHGIGSTISDRASDPLTIFPGRRRLRSWCL